MKTTINRNELTAKNKEIFDKIKKAFDVDKVKAQKFLDAFEKNVAKETKSATKKTTPKKKVVTKKPAPKKTTPKGKKQRVNYHAEVRKIMSEFGIGRKDALRIYKTKKKNSKGEKESITALISRFKKEFGAIKPHTSRDLKKDSEIKAKTSVKRKSPTYGKKGGAKKPHYYEYRMNRRDNSSSPAYLEEGGDVEFAKGGQVKPLTINFKYKGKPQSFTFTPESGEDWLYFDSKNTEKRFHVNYDEDYKHIVVYTTDDDEEIDYGNSIYVKELEDKDLQFYAKGGKIGFNPHKNTPLTFILKDEKGKEVFRTKSLNRASDESSRRGKQISILVIDSKGNTKKLDKGGEIEFAKGGKTDSIEYEKVLDILKENIDDTVEDLYSTYEGSERAEGEEVESKSRDGFIPYTNGGYYSRWFEYSNQLEGSGIGLPTKSLDDKIEEFRENNREYAKERFEEDYPEIVEELGVENIEYGSLYDAGYGDEAEELDMYENDDDDTVMMEIQALYYTPDNDRGQDGKHTIGLSGVVNLEAPYHRTGNLEDYIEKTFTFTSYKDLEDKLKKGLSEVLSWFEGDMYSKTPRELKIRRMDKGGDVEFAKGGILDFDVLIDKKPLLQITKDDFLDIYNVSYYQKEKIPQNVLSILKNRKELTRDETIEVLKKLRKDKSVEIDVPLPFSKGGEVEFAKGGTVKNHLDKADSHLREVGTKLYENKNPKELKFRQAKNKLDDSVDDLFTRRELTELGYAKGGEIEFEHGGSTDIANTILQQMGGMRRLVMFTGAKNFVALPNGVSFRIGNRSTNYVKITLNGKDLYDMEFALLRGSKMTNKKEFNDIYNDQLKPIFEKATGMYLSFEKGGEMHGMDCGCMDCVEVTIDDMVFVEPQEKEKFLSGGVIIGTLAGAYVGYKIGRAKPQKKGFETEKKVASKLKKEVKKVKDSVKSKNEKRKSQNSK